MNHEIEALREQLRELLTGRQSHITFDEVVKDFPADKRGAKPAGVPHSAWELIEHMRLAQSDILEFSRDPKHQSPHFPQGYWPRSEAPSDEQAWNECIGKFEADEKALSELASSGDLFARFPHGSGQTLLREIIVAANHNSYHLGQLAFLKKMLMT